MNTKHIDWSVYVITDRRTAGDRSLIEVVGAAIAGGVSVVQLRDKDTSTREMIELGQALHELTQAANIPLIVNDRIDVALALGAEGVHVGQNDMPAPLARQLIGPERILGVSALTVEHARQAEQDGADYLGVGDVFGTPTKADAGPAIGVARLAEIVRAVSIPCVAIGGITLQNAAAVVEAGAAGVSVISAIIGAPNSQEAARALHERIQRAR